MSASCQEKGIGKGGSFDRFDASYGEKRGKTFDSDHGAEDDNEDGEVNIEEIMKITLCREEHATACTSCTNNVMTKQVQGVIHQTLGLADMAQLLHVEQLHHQEVALLAEMNQDDSRMPLNMPHPSGIVEKQYDADFEFPKSEDNSAVSLDEEAIYNPASSHTEEGLPGFANNNSSSSAEISENQQHTGTLTDINNPPGTLESSTTLKSDQQSVFPFQIVQNGSFTESDTELENEGCPSPPDEPQNPPNENSPPLPVGSLLCPYEPDPPTIHTFSDTLPVLETDFGNSCLNPAKESSCAYEYIEPSIANTVLVSATMPGTELENHDTSDPPPVKDPGNSQGKLSNLPSQTLPDQVSKKTLEKKRETRFNSSGAKLVQPTYYLGPPMIGLSAFNEIKLYPKKEEITSGLGLSYELILTPFLESPGERVLTSGPDPPGEHTPIPGPDPPGECIPTPGTDPPGPDPPGECIPTPSPDPPGPDPPGECIPTPSPDPPGPDPPVERIPTPGPDPPGPDPPGEHTPASGPGPPLDPPGEHTPASGPGPPTDHAPTPVDSPGGSPSLDDLIQDFPFIEGVEYLIEDGHINPLPLTCSDWGEEDPANIKY